MTPSRRSNRSRRAWTFALALPLGVAALMAVPAARADDNACMPQPVTFPGLDTKNHCVQTCQSVVTVANTTLPFHYTVDRSASNPDDGLAATVPIPAGYTLVLEQVSGFVWGAAGTSWYIEGYAGNGVPLGFEGYAMPLQGYDAPHTGRQVFLTRLTVHARDFLTLSLRHNDERPTGSRGGQIFLSGRLIPTP